ncbi:MAG: hypothetical protein OEV43_09335 [Coriobacteriia bacterium]|nr:hypothetical protein [Coriobacteriia bacterium]
MARRSPTNPRYRRDAGVGKTRRSAASAKPKREVGERGSSGGGRKREPAKKRRWFDPLPTPDTPEFKRWRRIWAALFVIGAVLAVYALYARESQAGTLALVGAYICLLPAIYIDITKVRRMRKQLLAEQQSGGKKAKDDSSATGSADEKGR